MKKLSALAVALAFTALGACAESPVAAPPSEILSVPRFDSGGVAGSGNRLLPTDSTSTTGSSQTFGDPTSDEGDERGSGGVAGSGN